MVKTILFILTGLLCSSCTSGFKTKKSEIRILTPGFSASVANKPSPYKKSKPDNFESFSGLFQCGKPDNDSVHLAFNNNRELTLTFLYGGIEHTRVFPGTFSKKGYYEYYIAKKRIEIPPFLPILYSKVHIDRIRIGLTDSGDLIVDLLRENSGNIFILSDGHRYRYQLLFRCKIK